MQTIKVNPAVVEALMADVADYWLLDMVQAGSRINHAIGLLVRNGITKASLRCVKATVDAVYRAELRQKGLLSN